MSGEVKVSRSGNRSKFKKKDGLLYREFRLSARPRDVTDQLIVPQKFRTQVLVLAHESIMGGHLGTSKTADKLLISFDQVCKPMCSGSVGPATPVRGEYRKEE